MHRCNNLYPDGDFIRVIEMRVNKFTCTCFRFNSLSISPLTLFKYGKADQNTKTIKQYSFQIYQKRRKKNHENFSFICFKKEFQKFEIQTLKLINYLFMIFLNFGN